MTVRFSTPANRCPICGGCDRDPRGQEKRCSGFASDDGLWVRCTRVESPELDTKCQPNAWRHRMRDVCRCGEQHGPDSARVESSPAKPVEYVYQDEQRRPVLRVCVIGHGKGKIVWQEHWSPSGSAWVRGLGGARRLLYRLPELLAASPATVVWVVEGERDVETLRRRGMVATCSLGGAGKWALTDTAPLSGRIVCIVADDDAPGYAHAEDARKTTGGLVWRCTRGKDVTDHVAAGGRPLCDDPDGLVLVQPPEPPLTQDELRAVRAIINASRPATS